MKNGPSADAFGPLNPVVPLNRQITKNAYLNGVTASGGVFEGSALFERSGRFLDVRCLFALGSLDDLEADLLAFLERLETVHLNCREMSKQILAAFIGRDESVAFRVVEPFDRTS